MGDQAPDATAAPFVAPYLTLMTEEAPRWVVEGSFAWMTRFHRLARDYERFSETLVGLHFVAFAILLAQRCVTFMVQSA